MIDSALPRSSGVLLHPTSLPGPYGIGDLGPAAKAWVDSLASARQVWWQVLPLGPTGYEDSPYQCLSSVAGNPNLISPEALVADGLIPESALPEWMLPDGPIDYLRVSANKQRMLAEAWTAFEAGSAPGLRADWERFQAQESGWLDEFALFLALKEAHGDGSWMNWPDALRLREPAALAEARTHLAERIQHVRFTQFLFFRQWDRLREYARSKHVHLIGDMPIFLAEDSVDVWSRPDLFLLDANRKPRAVAGVPPDYFSATGQLWGNPLYDWPAHEASGFAWWAGRLRATLRLVDLVRLDHFRGFEAHWEIPAGSLTAETGRWVKGPGARLLEALRQQTGRLPIIAEDLGVITPEVDSLRLQFGLPGMRILQFAFGGAVERRFLPHNFENPTIVYTGTHDNDTTCGWFANITEAERANTRRYLGRDGTDIAWDLTRLAWASSATVAITTAQDVLSLGSEARMNIPGVPAGNWKWRLPTGGIGSTAIARLAEWTEVYERMVGGVSEKRR